MTDGWLVSDALAAQLRTVVLKVLGELNVTTGGRTRPTQAASWVEGYLAEALAASTGTGVTEATALVDLWGMVGVDDPVWTDLGKQVTVTNRDDTLTAVLGSRVICVKFGREWRVIWVGCVF